MEARKLVGDSRMVTLGIGVEGSKNEKKEG